MSSSIGAGSRARKSVVVERRPRGRPKVASDDEQRDMITDIAARLFLENGYGKTAMGEIAATARVSLTTIYRFFPAKSALFAAVVASHRQTMLALPGDYGDIPVDKALARIFQVDLDDRSARQRDALMTMFIVESRQFPELGPLLFAHGPERSRSLLVEWLDRQNELGRVRIADRTQAAAMIMDIAFGAIALKTSHTPQWPGSLDRRAYLKQCFAILADGLRPR